MKQIAWFFKTYFTFTLLFVVQKPLFMLLTPTHAGQNIDNLFSSAFEVRWHGLPLDLSLAGYFTIIPALLLLASFWMRKEIIRPVLNTYFLIAAVLMSFCFVLNIILYPYWSFPLDTTPFFYFFTSPSDALASASVSTDLLGILAMVA